ncbi:TPA: phosphate uptake regulator PhoU [Candidatus Woesearchaeota archaeon]|nr:phosphate uptake regulator PhoU [Candidatus Woesearchaeota archaeon]HIH46987.1 phosphate uptake regulator PhoU [Candidatus Woesearchaeota archaeon]HII88873.1 phosphate uptake regulator PhoU [Candidatus Woesearchaeota archaeon]
MKRKLVRQGGSAMTITLPSDWVKRFKLEGGDEIDLEEQQGKLIISTEAGKKENSIELSVSGLGPMVKRVLGALYKTGYDEFSIRFETPEEFETAQQVIREQFVGFELVDHQKKRFVARKISTIDSKEFDTLLRRMFIIIKVLGEELIEAIKEKDNAQLKMLALRDKDVNKLADFCRRTINVYGAIQFKRPGPLYFIVEQLEKVGDYYRDLCLELSRRDLNTAGVDLEYLKRVNLLYTKIYELYFQFEMEQLPELHALQKSIKEQAQELRKQEYDPLVLHYLQAIAESVFDMHGPLLTMKM